MSINQKRDTSELGDKMYRAGYIDGFKCGWYSLRREMLEILHDLDLLDSTVDQRRAELEKMYDIATDGTVLSYKVKKDTEATDEQ